MSWITTAHRMDVATQFGDLPGYYVSSNSSLYRVYRHVPGGDWDPPPPSLRKGRIDPPETAPGAYGILYTADCMLTAAFESRILRPTKDAAGNNTVQVVREEFDGTTSKYLQPPPRQAVHRTTEAVVFLDLDSPQLALVSDIPQSKPIPRISVWRARTHWVYQELIKKGDGNIPLPLVGVTFVSTIQDCDGRNFGVFDDRKDPYLARGTPPDSQSPLDLLEMQILWRNA